MKNLLLFLSQRRKLALQAPRRQRGNAAGGLPGSRAVLRGKGIRTIRRPVPIFAGSRRRIHVRHRQ